MAEGSTGRLPLKELRESMKRMQNEGERLVGRIRRDAGALAARGRREAVAGLLSDAQRIQRDLRLRAEATVRVLEARRARITASLEAQASRLVERVVKRLNVLTQDEGEELRQRLTDLERRLDVLSKERAA